MLNEIKNVLPQGNSNEGKTNQTGDSMNKFKDLNTITKKESLSTSKNDMYDIKNEIKLLQSKINGLGKTLCKDINLTLVNKKNSVTNSMVNSVRGEESFFNNLKNPNSESVSLRQSKLHKKNTLSLSITKKSNKNSPVRSKLVKSVKKKENSLSKSVKNEGVDGADYKTYCYREAITTWKEKYYKLMKDDQMVGRALEDERNKNEELTKHFKNLERKWNGYDKINYKYNKLIDEHEKVLIRYDESEMIRKQQSQMIKLLKKELHSLGKWSKDDTDETNEDNS